MTPRVRALKLAIESLKDDVQRVAFDANLHERYGADCPVTVKASKHRRELVEAIGELEKMVEEITDNNSVSRRKHKSSNGLQTVDKLTQLAL